MICIKTQHFNFHRIVLLAIGLWPYQRSRLTEFQLILFSGILASNVALQLGVFITTECSTDVVINVLSSALFFVMFVIGYNSFVMNFETVKCMFEHLQCICNELDENEISILKKYAKSAKRYTVAIIFLDTCYIVTVNLLPVIPRILDVLNKSQPDIMRQSVLPEYYIDQENYYYIILLFTNITLFIGGITITGTGAIIIAYCKHICGIFAIVSYRIKKAMMVNNDKEIMTYNKIIHAVDIHCQAIKSFEFSLSQFQISHFCLIIVGVVCLTLNLYGNQIYLLFITTLLATISETATRGIDIEKFYVRAMTVIAIFIYFYLSNHTGQEITDHHDFISHNAYNVQWYLAPLHVQRMILFLLQRGSKALYMNLGGLFSMSIELFSTLMKTSVSYFTIVYSTQH